MGLPTLARKGDQEAVRVGNMLMAFSAAVFNLCIRLAVPVTIENPARSRLWVCPPMVALLRRKRPRLLPLRSSACGCMWGKPWRKSTAFLSAHIAPDVLGSRRCLGAKRGCCKRTGNPHIVLSGLAPCGAFWTKVAEPFPASLCSCLADAFSNAFTAVQAKRFFQISLRRTMIPSCLWVGSVVVLLGQTCWRQASATVSPLLAWTALDVLAFPSRRPEQPLFSLADCASQKSRPAGALQL